MTQDREKFVAEAERKQTAYARDRKSATERVLAFYRQKFGEIIK